MAITHCWAADTLFDHVAEGLQWEPLIHTAGKGLADAGVKGGERVYVFAAGVEEDPWQADEVVLVGRFTALARAELTSAAADDSAVVTQLEAEEHLDVEELWKAPEHVVSVEGSGSPMDFRRVVPADVLESLGLGTGAEALAGTHRISAEAEEALEAFLAQADEVAVPRRATDRIQGLDEDGRAMFAVIEQAKIEEPDGLNDALERALGAAVALITAQGLVPTVPSLPPASDEELAELAAEADDDPGTVLLDLVDSLFGWALALADDAGIDEEAVDRLADEDATPEGETEAGFAALVAALQDAEEALGSLLPEDETGE